jgi:hypothetical protein
MLAFLSTVPPNRENGEQVAIHQICFSETSRNVHSVVFFVVKFEPSFDIAQACQGVITKHVSVRIFTIKTSELKIVASVSATRDNQEKYIPQSPGCTHSRARQGRQPGRHDREQPPPAPWWALGGSDIRSRISESNVTRKGNASQRVSAIRGNSPPASAENSR